MKVATWNIAGGRKINSKDHFDYQKSDLTYFIDRLRDIDADVVCLQEVEFDANNSGANIIATALEMPYIFETKMHVSHIDPSKHISIAILSKNKPDKTFAVQQPYPDFPLFLPNGDPAKVHLKYLQYIELNGVQIANTHTQPLEFLGTPYQSLQGKKYADTLSELFIESLNTPLVFAGDFNADKSTKHVSEIFDKACTHLGLSDVLPDGNTKPFNKGRPDALFISTGLSHNQSAIVQTETDHFLCWADIGTPSQN